MNQGEQFLLSGGLWHRNQLPEITRKNHPNEQYRENGSSKTEPSEIAMTSLSPAVVMT